MDAYSLTHGTRGLLLALGLTALPVWIVLARAHARLLAWMLSAPAAAILTIVGSVIGSILSTPIAAPLGPSSHNAAAAAVNALSLILVGYLGGVQLAKRRSTEYYKRGAVVTSLSPASRQGASLFPSPFKGEEPGGAGKRGGGRGGVTLAGLPVSYADETKHFKLIGTTGTGKSTAMREILSTALARGDRAVIADPDGGYLERFYDPVRGDVILNPFDGRSATWDLFAEITTSYDVDQLTHALITDTESASGREWRGYARTFLTAVLRRFHEQRRRDIPTLWRTVAIAPKEDLEALLQGTPAQPFLTAETARMLGAIRAIAVSALAPLEYIADQRTTPISIRSWIRTGQGALFMPYQATQIAALRSLISAWMRLAIFETMNRTETLNDTRNGPATDQRLWFMVDELDALGAIDGLKDALARLRKFGGRCVLGFQSIAQVSSTYGSGEAQTIVENCGNTLILRCSASEGGGTSRFASRLIGDREIVRLVTSKQRQPERWLASTGTSEHHVIEAAVMASEIEQLPDLEGLLKFASEKEWRRVIL